MWLPTTYYTLRDLVGYLEERHRRYGQQDAIALSKQCLDDLSGGEGLEEAHRLVGLMLSTLHLGQRIDAAPYGHAALAIMEQQLPTAYRVAAAEQTGETELVPSLLQ